MKNLIKLYPEYYSKRETIYSKNIIHDVFCAKSSVDFDFLEDCISRYDYYNQPHCWSLGMDDDKKLMAEMMSCFSPARALELGCSVGAIIKCLKDRGVYCEGIEISRMSLENAFPEIKNQIHCGDLLNLNFPNQYDLIFGLDIFEHLNPNKFKQYLEKICKILMPGGYVFANIPAFGKDKVFGEIFSIYISDWIKDVKQNRHFSVLHVDSDGYPLHGHLIWAHTDWWVNQFAEAGLHRIQKLEQAFHAYDSIMFSEARRSFYIFRKT